MVQSQRYQTRENATMQKLGHVSAVIAALKNISKSGVCLEWSNDGFHVAKGDLVNLTIHLDQVGKKYSLSGKVIWRIGRRSGIQFMTPEQLMRELLSKSNIGH